ncbi:hypothetical protein [Sphingomonas sp. Leaf10]|uniref:hypothetical protein n=1 Tax=Sphingomonas sp. Leaf10 TaxID=1735676 RepID=UPI0012E21A4D|nr:hypothetical protein [Sphingomonas sp. Leaf10]
MFGLSGIAAGAGAIIPAGKNVEQQRVDDTEDPLQRRYDALATAGGGTLELPVGTHRVSLNMHSRKVHLRGAGRDATILMPRDPALPILSQRYSIASWDAVTIADLTLRGKNAGIGLGYGTVEGDQFGGTRVCNVKFTGFEKSISRPTGNIGLYLEDCQFEDADYHLWGHSFRGKDDTIMHSGVLSVRRCHFQDARKAVLYVDSPVIGSGQIVFDECIFENNPGFVFVFVRFESRDGVPGVSIRSCWNEANGTGGIENALVLAGKRQMPAFLFADRVGTIDFHDTPLGKIILLGDTSITTRSCALDLFAVEHADAAAAIVHYDARIFGGQVVPGVTRSLANANQRNSGPGGAIFQLPHRIGVVHPQIDEAYAVSTCHDPIVADGKRRLATHSVVDAILPGSMVSQQMEFETGDGVYLGPIQVPRAAWIAWTLAYRKVAGGAPTLSINGRMGVSVNAPLDATEWTTIGGVAFVDRPLDQIGFLLQATTRASLRIGGYQLICFRTRQAATEMLNDQLFREPQAGPR